MENWKEIFEKIERAVREEKNQLNEEIERSSQRVSQILNGATALLELLQERGKILEKDAEEIKEDLFQLGRDLNLIPRGFYSSVEAERKSALIIKGAKVVIETSSHKIISGQIVETMMNSRDKRLEYRIATKDGEITVDESEIKQIRVVTKVRTIQEIEQGKDKDKNKSESILEGLIPIIK